MVLWREPGSKPTVMVFMRSRSRAEEGWLSRSMERERPRDWVILCSDDSPEPVMMCGSWRDGSEPCEEEPLGVKDDVICCVTLGVGILSWEEKKRTTGCFSGSSMCIVRK